MINVQTRLKCFKKVYDLHDAKLLLKTVRVNLKKLKDAVNNEVVQITNLDILKTKINKLKNKISYAITLIHISQYNTDKQYITQ